jgi:mannose-1-phosphate guanylyltransferase
MGQVADYVEKHDVLMTLGIVPTTPDANFGYIQVRGGKKAIAKGGPLQVKTFTEKPEEELAKVFISTGEFFWNSGIFAWKARVIREEMEFFLPEVTELFNGWEACLADPGFIQRAYAECPRISLDYGIMERTGRAWLYPARFDWQDRGRE